ncbi:Protein of unknown function [Gryllus bimaculatus]|nr:Protein of unknown function [Gryllus bimaculatus]
MYTSVISVDAEDGVDAGEPGAWEGPSTDPEAIEHFPAVDPSENEIESAGPGPRFRRIATSAATLDEPPPRPHPYLPHPSLWPTWLPPPDFLPATQTLIYTWSRHLPALLTHQHHFTEPSLPPPAPLHLGKNRIAISGSSPNMQPLLLPLTLM